MILSIIFIYFLTVSAKVHKIKSINDDLIGEKYGKETLMNLK